MWARHAVETSRRTYIVGRERREADEQCPQVSEVNTQGHVIRTCSNEVQLNCTPCCLATDSIGRVLVTDNMRRVVLFSRKLTYERILLDFNQRNNQ